MTRTGGRRLHPAWVVAGVALLALIGAAGMRSAPGVLIQPLHQEFGWSTGMISLAVSVNLLFFGLTAPFSAALMERLGIRVVMAGALLLIGAGAGLTVFMSASWQLVLLWGVLVGLGTGSMALGFVALLVGRWFVRRQGLVTGVLTAGTATGQLIFLPTLAAVTQASGWRAASIVVTAGALVMVPVVLAFMRNSPAEVGVVAYGADPGVPAARPAVHHGVATRAIAVLGRAARRRSFWLLAGSFAICGASTNGLVGTHFVPAAHDHGMPSTTAAGLLALVGVFDVLGTVASGWLTDRVDARYLLAAYYLLRGASLGVLPGLFGPSVQPPMWAFIVFYGLDWVATVPPTVTLCRRIFGEDGPIVFSWVFASHQVGAAVVATAAGVIRDATGAYTWAWLGSAGLCGLAMLFCLAIRRPVAVG